MQIIRKRQIVFGLVFASVIAARPALADKKLDNYDNWNPNIPVATEAFTQKTVPLPGFKEFISLVGRLSSPLKDHPEMSSCWLDRATRLMDFGLYQEAIGDLKAANSKCKPGDNRALVKLAQCYFNLQDYPQSLWIAKKIQAGGKDLAEGHATKALGLYDHPDRAVKECDKAIAANPKQSWFYVTRARINQGNNRAWVQSVEDLNTAIKLDKSNLSAWLFRANAFIKLNQNDKALKDLNHILSEEPLYFEAYKLRAVVYRNSGKRDLAKKDDFLYTSCLNRMRQIVKESQS